MGCIGGCIFHSPLDPPLSALIAMSLTTTPSSRFGFSMMWRVGQILSKQFRNNSTKAIALAQFGHFTFWFQTSGSNPQPHPRVRHCQDKLRKVRLAHTINGKIRVKKSVTCSGKILSEGKKIKVWGIKLVLTLLKT